MKVNAIGLLRNAAHCIENRKRDDGAYAYSLEQLADHLIDVRDGKHTWEEFAEFYCLTAKKASA